MILQFIKKNKELFQKPALETDWNEIYARARKAFAGQISIGKLNEFLLNHSIYPQKYMKRIPDDFLKDSSITKFIVPDSIDSIGTLAFYNCKSLETILLPNTLTSIGDYAFGHCKSLKEISIPSNIKIINDYLFCGCKSLQKITLPNNLKEIRDRAFANCSSLRQVNISDSVFTIYSRAFEGCEKTLIIDYEGTKSQWKRIYKDNSPFTVHCFDGTIYEGK